MAIRKARTVLSRLSPLRRTGCRFLLGSAALAATVLSRVPVGAQAPAFRVKDINAQTVVSSSMPRKFFTIDETTFFLADGSDGTALWKTDGSATGTQRLSPGL